MRVGIKVWGSSKPSDGEHDSCRHVTTMLDLIQTTRSLLLIGTHVYDPKRCEHGPEHLAFLRVPRRERCRVIGAARQLTMQLVEICRLRRGCKSSIYDPDTELLQRFTSLSTARGESAGEMFSPCQARRSGELLLITKSMWSTRRRGSRLQEHGPPKPATWLPPGGAADCRSVLLLQGPPR